MWRRAWDWVADLLPEEVWMVVGIGLLLLAVALPIAYIWGRRHTGEAEAAVRERVEDFATTLAGGDGGTACGMLAADAAAQLVRRVGLGTPEAVGGVRSCEEAVRVAATRRKARQTEALRDIEVLDVDYEEEWSPAIGDNPGNYEGAIATARLRGGEVELSTDSVWTDNPEEWTIESADPILLLMSQGP